ncbi:signal recognition particle-docking protein FtsY [Xanthobacter sediminis]
MSHQDTPLDPNAAEGGGPADTPKTEAPKTEAPKIEAPKKKRGLWGWLTGRAEEEASAAEAALAEAPAELARDTPAPPASATTEARGEGAAPASAKPSARAEAAETAAEAPAGPASPAEPASGIPLSPAPAAAEERVQDAPVSGGHVPATAPVPAVDDRAALAPIQKQPEEVHARSVPAPDAAQLRPPAVPEAPAAAGAEPAAEVGATAPAEGTPPAEEPPAPAAEDAPAVPAKKGFWVRLASGLARTASSLGQGITDLVSKRKLDAETLEELEEVLIRADLGVETAMRIVEAVGKGRHDKMIAPDEVKGLIAAEVERILEPVAKPLVVDAAQRPFVVLMVGVNGSGKTTTIGKLAAQWRQDGKKVVLAAGDTFRAAAIDQLKVWGQRTGTKVIAREPGADAAGVAHEALTEARAEGADILLIDTAGRLQNRTELMAELEKIVRVVKKLEPSAPHAVLLVLDATVGQNALSQVEAFTRIAGVTGLVMTKLDGTARGGILVAIAAKHRLPVHLIGVGEGADDLQPFTARDFARAIAGLD